MEEMLESLNDVHREFQSMFVEMAEHLTRLDAQNADLVARIAALEARMGKEA